MSAPYVPSLSMESTCFIREKTKMRHYNDKKVKEIKMKKNCNRKTALLGSALFLTIGTLGTWMAYRMVDRRKQWSWGEVSLR